MNPRSPRDPSTSPTHPHHSTPSRLWRPGRSRVEHSQSWTLTELNTHRVEHITDLIVEIWFFYLLPFHLILENNNCFAYVVSTLLPLLHCYSQTKTMFKCSIRSRRPQWATSSAFRLPAFRSSASPSKYVLLFNCIDKQAIGQSLTNCQPVLRPLIEPFLCLPRYVANIIVNIRNDSIIGFRSDSIVAPLQSRSRSVSSQVLGRLSDRHVKLRI